MTYINTQLEERLIEVGFDDMTLADKNKVIALFAQRESKMYSEITTEYVLDKHKQLQIDVLSGICEDKIVEGFTASNGHRYRTNRDDQVNMIGQHHELIADATITVVHWKTEDAGYVQHTREEWLAVYTEAFAHKKAQLFRYNSLKQRILTASKSSEVVAIKWDTQL